MRTKLLSAIVVFFTVICLFPVSLASDISQEIEYQEDGSYFITVLEDDTPGISLLSTTTKTKSKTTTCYNADGTSRWSIKVTGTFTYGDGSAKCTASSVTAQSYDSHWTIVSKSASRSGNKAIATATANNIKIGTVQKTVSKSVTLTCSATGVFS
ncbi:MAG: hypothetical protein LUD84_10005 [Clostridiales bacterium]|nr:hypothetical protein [Clostridiales bacterium]